MIKTILFDLDGTLLPMNQNDFIKSYFGLLSKKASKYGYEPEKLIKTIWKATDAMVKNDGSNSNEEVFWNSFKSVYGEKALSDKIIFDDFYKNEFQNVKQVCGFNSLSKTLIDKCKSKGYNLVVATNPLFPDLAIRSRIAWAGLNENDFDYYTTYENSYHSKPNLDYYWDILKKVNCKPEECLMIGNDVSEDMVVTNLGMNTFLLTDCLINKDETDISVYKKGSFIDLINYIDSI